MRLKGFYSTGIIGFCVVFILAVFSYLNYLPCFKSVNNKQNYVETILDMTRSKIRFETWDYNFSYSGVNSLDDLLMESGGTPVRSLIVSTWRSGSSFLGDLLNAMPSNFYHYEPLIKYKSKQVQKQPHTDNATRILKNMFKCNFSGMEDYFEFGKVIMKNGYFKFNTRLWESCKNKNELCSDANFTASFCKLFPFQNMKVVRLRLRFMENLLDDEELNIKVVLLIRDPRGVMLSRKRISFCTNPDCSNPERLCTDMISDYVATNQLLQKYPGRLMVLRFEDLAMNLNETTYQLLKFLQLEPNQSIDEFLSSHTKVEKGNAFSTFRVSQKVVYKWKTRLDFNNVSKIQEVCKEAMDLWGYELADSALHLTSEDFRPLKSYSMNMTGQGNHSLS